MASIKKLDTRKFKITVSNGYRPDGRKISRAKTITVPLSVGGRGIPQYVAHKAEEFEKLVKSGYCEDGEMSFQEYAVRWLERQTKYAPSTLGFYRRSLETVYPMIGSIKLNRLRPIALENLLVELRKRIYHGKPIQEATVQKYLTVVSAVLSDAKRNEIIEKNPARMIDLPDTARRAQMIPTDTEAHRFLDVLANEEDPYKTFYALAIYSGCRRGELCALKWDECRSPSTRLRESTPVCVESSPTRWRAVSLTTTRRGEPTNTPVKRKRSLSPMKKRFRRLLPHLKMRASNTKLTITSEKQSRKKMQKVVK